MKSGRIKWFDEKKGYGFIETDKKDLVFLHYSAVSTDRLKDLKEGTAVNFTQEKDGEILRVKELSFEDPT
ncbi:cold-shock protein [Bdellovibrio svalbardensis]|uniref:Cold shock domain-containing protein n=1 Tax=Bdellovibrio svalbardensis TaxID=2972972 RepID=A0ABT6DHJ0_9BACT|nr:cold shock domain-containing protein [Bdellovibrio svalbardensis]MDG0815942.1 cold shock domain-containing protein [Bdellovibrio svalbardensis]